MKPHNLKSYARNFSRADLLGLFKASWSFIKKYRLYLALSLLHYLLLAACGFVMIAEAGDRFDGENNYDISEATLQLCITGVKILLFPIGYLFLLEASFFIGVAALNSLFIGFSPVWIPKIWKHVKEKKASKSH